MTKTAEASEDKCVICGEPIEGFGHNALPFAAGRCCDTCNETKVIPARIKRMREER